MDVKSDVAACIVCRSPTSVFTYALNASLAKTAYSVARFLSMYNVLGQDCGVGVGHLCDCCHNLVVRCDTLHFELFSTVDELRNKTLPICEETGFLAVKQEDNVQLDDPLAPEESNIVVLLPAPSEAVAGNESARTAVLSLNGWNENEECSEPYPCEQLTPCDDAPQHDETGHPDRVILHEDAVTGPFPCPDESSRNSADRDSSKSEDEAVESAVDLDTLKFEEMSADLPLKSVANNVGEETPRVVRPRKTQEATTAAAKFCPLCGEPAIPGKFMQHVRSVHPEVKRLKAVPADWLGCEMCPYKTKLKERLERHLLLKHKIGKMIPCPDCDKLLTTKERLLAHANLVHGKAKAFKCDKCDKAFSSYPGLYAHAKFHSTEVVMRICEECGEEVDSRRYVHHVWSKHKPKRVEETWCEHCGKFFKCKKGFVKHLAKSHGIGEVRKASSEIVKICSECGKQVKSDELFYAHLFVKHGIERPELKKRPCPHCEEIFYVKDKLQAHIQLHTGEKKYVCADCGYSTRFSGNLHKHRKGVHGKGKAAHPSS